MKKRKKDSICMVIGLFCMLFVWPVFAADYDLFVDADAEKGGNGSSSKPFREIEDALDVARKGDKIIVQNGTYEGGFTITEGVHLQGSSESKVRINNAIVMEDGSSISNLTVSGGYSSITIKSGANVKITECTVKDFKKIGINILAGNGKLVVEKVDITGGRGKGFYVEMGNRLELSSSMIHDNQEEGVDIRQKVDGFITGNEIYDNGESGIEVVLGSADLSIKDNSIIGNGSSGIATQYYKIANKPGGIKIESNSIEKNKKFGIDCNVPQGGSPGASYWLKGLDVAKNNFSDNGMGRINSKCSLVEADKGDGGEEYDVSKESEDVQSQSGTEKKTAVELAEQKEKESERLEEIKKQSEHLQTQLDEVNTDFEQSRQMTKRAFERIDGQNVFFRWFWGADRKSLRVLERSKLQMQEKITQLDQLIFEGQGNPVVSQLEAKKIAVEEDANFIAQKIKFEQNRFTLFFIYLKITEKLI